MKKWNTPEIAALDLNATESGSIWSPVEFHFEYHGIFVDIEKNGGPGEGHCGGNETGKDSGDTPSTGDVTDSIS
jgi:hypothetical protein